MTRGAGEKGRDITDEDYEKWISRMKAEKRDFKLWIGVLKKWEPGHLSTPWERGILSRIQKHMGKEKREEARKW